VDVVDDMDEVDGVDSMDRAIFKAEPHAPYGAPHGMKIRKNRGWTLMDADIPAAGIFPRSVVRIFGIEAKVILSAKFSFAKHFQDYARL